MGDGGERPTWTSPPQSPAGTRKRSEGIQVNKSHDELSYDVKEASS